MTAQHYLNALIIYFVGLFILCNLMFMAGATDNSYTTSYQKFDLQKQAVNDTKLQAPTGLGSTSYFKSLFSFFVWDFSFSNGVLSNYQFFFKLIFVWLPLIILALTFWYSTAFSG